jgi:hypothetical protein
MERGRGDVDPVQAALDPSARLVEAHRRRVFEQGGDDIEEQAQAATRLGYHCLDGAHWHRRRQDVGEDLGEAVVGHVLVDRQVHAQCPNARPITRRGPGLVRSRCLGFTTTRAAQFHQLVLGDMRWGPWHLEDLAPLDRHDLGLG